MRVLPPPSSARLPQRKHLFEENVSDESYSVVSSDENRETHHQEGEKHRKTKLEKIRELLNENLQLKEEAIQLKQQLKQQQVLHVDGNPPDGQGLSGEATKEDPSKEALQALTATKEDTSSKEDATKEDASTKKKHVEALLALTAVTKTQQESLAAYYERTEALVKELDERDVECQRLRQELDKKKRQVTMLEIMVDLDLVEITSLRKEVMMEANKKVHQEIRDRHLKRRPKE